jgi:hypothetical protein
VGRQRPPRGGGRRRGPPPPAPARRRPPGRLPRGVRRAGGRGPARGGHGPGERPRPARPPRGRRERAPGALDREPDRQEGAEPPGGGGTQAHSRGPRLGVGPSGRHLRRAGRTVRPVDADRPGGYGSAGSRGPLRAGAGPAASLRGGRRWPEHGPPVARAAPAVLRRSRRDIRTAAVRGGGRGRTPARFRGAAGSAATPRATPRATPPPP